MKTAAVPAEPTLPFIRMNRHHIVGFTLDDPYSRMAYEQGFPKMNKCDFEDGRFKEDACIIDVDCWKFPIHDVVSLGPSLNFWDVFWRAKRVKVKYIYDTPVKLTFDEALAEIVELVCRYRLHNKPKQGRETQEKFLARVVPCKNMHDLIIGRPNPDPKSRKRTPWIGGVSFYGEWVG